MIQASRLIRVGLSPRHGDQVRIVDDALHRDAEADVAKEVVERARAEQGDREHDHLAPGDEHATELERLLRQVLLEHQVLLPVPERPTPQDDQQDADRRDDLHRGALPLDRARQQLEQQPLDRGQHADRQQRRDRPRQAVRRVQPVEDEHADRGHRAVREVEDPRRLVGEDQPGAGQAVHRSADESDDQEREQIVEHVTSALEAMSSGPRPIRSGFGDREVRAPNGIRTRATALKGRRPGPLDDGGASPYMLAAAPAATTSGVLCGLS